MFPEPQKLTPPIQPPPQRTREELAALVLRDSIEAGKNPEPPKPVAILARH